MDDASTLTPATDASTARPILGGDTEVTLTAAGTLQSLGIGVAPLGTAAIDASGPLPVADFPITGGTAGPGPGLVILHEGSGLELTGASTALDLSDFLIDTEAGVVNADLAVNGEAAGNAPVFAIGADGATLTLTAAAAEALDRAFGTDAFEPGLEIGIAAPAPVLGPAVVEPGPSGDGIDWNALAAQVQANFAATGQWFL